VFTDTQYVVQTGLGYKLYGYQWIVEKPLAIIQIIHGLAEHSGRYSHLAKHLNRAGYTVIAFDHRGHGLTAENNQELKGFFSEECGWELIVNDIQVINKTIQKKFPDKKIYILGHSMGSFLAQNFMIDFRDSLDGLILTGSNWEPRWYLVSLSFLIAFEKWRNGTRNSSSIIDHIYNLTLNFTYRKDHKDYGWISSDLAEVYKYSQDKNCGFSCTTSLWEDLFRGMSYIFSRQSQEKVREDIPIYILGGKEDSLSHFGKGLIKLYESFKKIGVKDLNFKLYDGMRHEIFHEKKQQEVMDDLVLWLNSREKS
tara:strand:+ start:297 stop:1229 length:933 start_codon:yes stop_codon:yes gene_type:complete